MVIEGGVIITDLVTKLSKTNAIVMIKPNVINAIGIAIVKVMMMMTGLMGASIAIAIEGIATKVGTALVRMVRTRASSTTSRMALA
jgi:hypothetical protein